MVENFDGAALRLYHGDMNSDLSTMEFFQEVERKVRRLFRLQRREPIRNRFDLTDVLQEVNAQICSRANENEPISHFLDTAWLGRVTTGHFCKLQRLNLAKKRSVAAEESHDVELLSNPDSVCKQLEIAEQAEILLKSLESLDADTRHVLIRRHYDDATIKDIAAELNTSEYGVKSMYDDGLCRLELLMAGESQSDSSK